MICVTSISQNNSFNEIKIRKILSYNDPEDNLLSNNNLIIVLNKQFFRKMRLNTLLFNLHNFKFQAQNYYYFLIHYIDINVIYRYLVRCKYEKFISFLNIASK